MTKNLQFPKAAFIGYENLLASWDAIAAHAQDNYPPYNVLELTETEYLIELAVAGFDKKDITIELVNQVLTITAKRERLRPETWFIHRGISSKAFKKSFKVVEYAEVTGAELNSGILTVSIEVKVPDKKLPKVIKIK